MNGREMAAVMLLGLGLMLGLVALPLGLPQLALLALSLLALAVCVLSPLVPTKRPAPPRAAPAPPKVQDLRTDLAANYLLAGFDLDWIRRNIEDPLGGPVPEYVTPITVTPAPKPVGTNRALLQAIHDEWTKS